LFPSVFSFLRMTKDWVQMERNLPSVFPVSLISHRLISFALTDVKKIIAISHCNMRTQIWVFYWGMSPLFTSPHSVLIKTSKFLYIYAWLVIWTSTFLLIFWINGLISSACLCICSLMGTDCAFSIGTACVRRNYVYPLVSVGSLTLHSSTFELRGTDEKMRKGCLPGVIRVDESSAVLQTFWMSSSLYIVACVYPFTSRMLWHWFLNHLSSPKIFS